MRGLWRTRWCYCLLLLGGLLPLYRMPEGAAEEIQETPLTDTDREHWSFQPVIRHPLPELRDPNSAQTAIDVWIQARLERSELTLRPPAARATWLRRASLLVMGLPPPPAELAAFENSSSPDAYERQIDRLLASPAFGERMAQPWLDLARFAETDGYEHDKLRPQAWRYRDWVIGALNADLPYDRFLQQQLAGDLETTEGASALPTAFCLSGPDMPDINSQMERRHMLLNELTATVGSAILGLQFGCAQCHDHKYDPISQADFYRLRAFFEPAVQLVKNEPVSVLADKALEPAASFLYHRGDWRQPGPRVEAAAPRVLAAALPWPLEGGPTARSNSRSQLVAWLTTASHPLTARVETNRLWQLYFGAGLCRSPSDLGVLGESPSHPELLDLLASELTRVGWHRKKLHRWILASAVFQQASFPLPASIHAADPENRWLARFPRQRLEGEALRDSMLAAAGVLNRRGGGPGVMASLPPELHETLLKDQWKATRDLAEHDRRSVYLFARRNLRFPLFDVFDRPDGNASCAVRHRSTTALQALHLLNSEFSLHAARRLAGDLWQGSPEDAIARIRQLYLRTLGRAPLPQELQDAHQFLQAQRELLAGEQRDEERLALPLPWSERSPEQRFEAAAWTDLCLAMFNLNEFIHVE